MNSIKKASFLLLFLISQALLGQTNEERLQHAYHAQEALKYDEAIQQYESLMIEGFLSADLYFNTAMAYYDKGELGNAILYMEKAKRQTPYDSAILSNLNLFQNEQTDGLLPLPKFFLKVWLDSASARLNPTTWGLLAIFFSALTALIFSLWSLKKMLTWRKHQLLASPILLLLAIAFFFLGHSRKNTLAIHNEAIITASVLDIYIAPGDDADTDGEIHTGLKVIILDQFEGWTKIRLVDGREGWIKDDGIAVI